MKKTIVTLMTLCGVSMADTLTYSQYEEAGLLDGLQAAWDFSSQEANVLSFGVTNSFNVANGIGSVGNSTTPYSTTMANSFETSAFTISFDLLSYSAAHTWRNILSLYNGGGNGACLALTTDDSGVILYNYGFAGSSTTSALVASLGALGEDGMNITLTYDNGTIVTYVDGVSKGSHTLTWANATTLEQSLTGMQFNCEFGGGRLSTSQTLDNLAMWNKALTAEQVSMIATGVIPSESPTAPEPATATLSLLALAGLAARRRRASR